MNACLVHGVVLIGLLAPDVHAGLFKQQALALPLSGERNPEEKSAPVRFAESTAERIRSISFDNPRPVSALFDDLADVLLDAELLPVLSVQVIQVQNRLLANWANPRTRPAWAEAMLDRFGRLANDAEQRWRAQKTLILSEGAVSEIEKVIDPKSVSLISLDGASASGKSTMAAVIAKAWRRRNPDSQLHVIELDLALRDQAFRYAIEHLVTGEPLTDEDRKALADQSARDPAKAVQEVEGRLDRAFGTQQWREWTAAKPFVAYRRAFSEEELGQIQPGQPFLQESRFWHHELLEQLLLIPHFFKKLRSLKLYVGGYDRAAKGKRTVQEPVIQPGDGVLLVGKYVNEAAFAGRYALRMREHVAASRARKQYMERLTMRGAQTGVPLSQRIAFYDLGLRPSWEEYDERTRPLIDVLLDAESGVIEHPRSSITPRQGPSPSPSRRSA